MVKDVKKYVDEFSTLNPEYITFHLETVNNVIEMISYIKQKGIKAGLAINPDTDVKKVYPYLDLVDLVLVMSVEPGKGGQKFLDSATSKIVRLKELKMDNGFNYQIEVDGGVNGETFTKCLNCDIFVVGSYITCSENYEERIQEVYSIIKA